MSLSLDELACCATEAFEDSQWARSQADDLAGDAGHWIQQARLQFGSEREHRAWLAEHVLIPKASVPACIQHWTRMRADINRHVAFNTEIANELKEGQEQ